MRSEAWIDVLERAALEIEARRSGLEAELGHELALGGDMIALARGFARFHVLAAQECREAAAALDRVTLATDGLLAAEAAQVELLVDLGQRLQTQCQSGLLQLRERLAQSAAASIHECTGALREALATLDRGDGAACVPAGDTQPVSVAGTATTPGGI
jgi:hypothetical protein